MKELFLTILNSGIIASFIIIAIVLIRLFFKKIPKRILPLLWLIVAVRLILPINIESNLSLVPSIEPITDSLISTPASTPSTTPDIYFESPIIPDGPSDENVFQNHTPITPTETKSIDAINIVSNIWLIGVIIVLLYGVISYLILARKLIGATKYKDNIWQSEKVHSPFILGFFKARIYIPYNIEDDVFDVVLMHENAHIKRLDHIIKPVAFILLAIYWFNPLVCLAYILLCKDIELACDETVIAKLPENARTDYATSIVKCGVNKADVTVCPIAFGEISIKERVKTVMNYKKPAFWIIITSIVLCITIVVCFLTVRPEDSKAGADLGTSTPGASSTATNTAINTAANTNQVQSPTSTPTLVPDNNDATPTADSTATTTATTSATAKPTNTSTAKPTATPKPENLNHSGRIPNGAKYVMADGQIFNPGDKFPSRSLKGDTYTYGDYEYKFKYGYTGTKWNDSIGIENGWGVRVLDKTKTSYGSILESINSKDVSNLFATFKNCTNLKTAPKIPSNTVKMDDTFYGCTSLTAMPEIPNKVTRMYDTFSSCSSLTTVTTIPSSVTVLNFAFANCTSLVTAPKIYANCEYLSRTFLNCTSLKNVPLIPNGVTDLTETFMGCTSLTKTPTLPDSIHTLDSTFRDCTALTTVTNFPKNIRRLDFAFTNCTKLTSVADELPNNTEYAHCAFENCTSLKKAPKIPASVIMIRDIFSGCTSLTGTVTINANPTYYENAFKGVNFKTQNLTLTGSSTLLNEIKATGIN